MSFKVWEPQFLAMVTFGYEVGNHEFQISGFGNRWKWKSMVATLGTMSFNFVDAAISAIVVR